MSFEQLVDTLDELARRISSGEVGIEEAARLYELAGAVHEEASLRLERVRAKVEGLIGPTEPGPVEAGPGTSDGRAETAGPT
jgi:exodeoxyribonuclease VII small subunit